VKLITTGRRKTLPMYRSTLFIIVSQPLRNFLPILLTLMSLTVAQSAHAVSPPPDGGYPDDNTAEGTDALFKLTSGIGNTAIGFDALYNNATGNSNTASGASALFSNTTGMQNTANGVSALFSNISGSDNTADGRQAIAS